MSKAVAVTSEYRNLPLAQLQESPTNPRRRYDERALEELAASFVVQGVLQPLLVRAIDDGKYEIVAGARRFRAAKLAALEEVPVRVVELSDAAVRESQLTENLLREDVHPYEEALALSGLLHLKGAQYDVASISARLGKSPSYVMTRIRLTELEPTIAEVFLADQIGVGHALEIAKLPQPQQLKAFDAAFRTVWNGGKESRVVLPLRDFSAWIEQNILLSLDSVPFDKNDATLVPEAGSCAECSKRTGFNTLLFGEMSQRDQCSDGTCFNNKLGKFVERQIAEKPKLVQITTAHGPRGDGAVLPRNRYVALNSLETNEGKATALALPEVVQAHGGGDCGGWCRARPYGQSLCGAELHGSLRRPHQQDARPGSNWQRRREQRHQGDLRNKNSKSPMRHRVLAEVLKRIRHHRLSVPTSCWQPTHIARKDRSRCAARALARRHKMVDGSTPAK
jgi:ParB family chromosome partitioning protein